MDIYSSFIYNCFKFVSNWDFFYLRKRKINYIEFKWWKRIFWKVIFNVCYVMEEVCLKVIKCMIFGGWKIYSYE